MSDDGSASALVKTPGYCTRCVLQNEVGIDACSRCGGFVVANQKQLRHGGRRRHVLGLTEARQSDLYRGWVEHLGGEQNLTAPILALVVRAVEADAIAETAMNYLRKRGASLTGTREQRAIQTFFTALDRLHRVATTLGLERRQRDIPDLASVLSEGAE